VATTFSQLNWMHELSQSALAVAIVVLGVVIMLELRSIRSMKRTLDGHLARVFEQLDLLRLDHSSPIQDVADARPMPVAVPVLAPVSTAGASPYAAATVLASSGMCAEEIARRCGLAAGEARLLASLAAAKSSRREQTDPA
jgi:Protein of unknown function (DUF2802)